VQSQLTWTHQCLRREMHRARKWFTSRIVVAALRCLDAIPVVGATINDCAEKGVRRSRLGSTLHPLHPKGTITDRNMTPRKSLHLKKKS
jgi:hypothetical protein